MKKLMIGLLTFGSLTAFADVSCVFNKELKFFHISRLIGDSSSYVSEERSLYVFKSFIAKSEGEASEQFLNYICNDALKTKKNRYITACSGAEKGVQMNNAFPVMKVLVSSNQADEELKSSFRSNIYPDGSVGLHNTKVIANELISELKCKDI